MRGGDTLQPGWTAHLRVHCVSLLRFRPPGSSLGGIQSVNREHGGATPTVVHSFHFRVADPAHLLAHADYGGSITAIVGRDNLIGTQFHPEKSAVTGLRMIANFLTWRP